MSSAEKLHRGFQEQAEQCMSLGSPFMGRLLPLIAQRAGEDTLVGEALLNWPGNPGPWGDVLGLRLAGGLHALALSGQAPELSTAYPPNEVSDDALWEAIRGAFVAHGEALCLGLKSPPQTNEVRRSAGLAPALGVIADELGLPIVLSEIGASAGLNLSLDRYAIEASGFSFGPSDAVLTLRPEWRGGAPKGAPLQISERQGCDIAPIDLSDDQAKLRLLSYLWADQPDRLALTRAAIAVAGYDVVAEDALTFLTRRLRDRAQGAVHVVMHSIAWQYLSPADKDQGDKIIAEAGRAASSDAPLARVAMEADEAGPGAALTLQTWPNEKTRTLARVDFHGRWVDWLS